MPIIPTYCAGQTLYNKETKELARLTHNPVPGKKVTLVGSEGRVFTSLLKDYAPIVNELGVIQRGSPRVEEGETVDFTLRKYIV